MITQVGNEKYHFYSPLKSYGHATKCLYREKLEYLQTAVMTRTLCIYENLIFVEENLHSKLSWDNQLAIEEK